jgi:radical SAM family protein/Wzt-like putative exopolysaccharide export protein
MTELENQPGLKGPSHSGVEVLLCTCPPWDVVRPPLNIAALWSFLRAKDIPAGVWDLNTDLHHAIGKGGFADLWDRQSFLALDNPETTVRFVEQLNGLDVTLAEMMLATGARVIGFSIHAKNFMFAEHLTNVLKRLDPDVKVILGGPQTSWLWAIDELHASSADAFVLGEGEATLLEALNSLKEKSRFEPIPGLVVSKGRGNGVSRFVRRPVITDLDSLPATSYEPFDMGDYKPGEFDEPLSFLFSRGCIGSCAFCNDRLLSGKYRTRTAEHAVNELKANAERHGVTMFKFNDLTCNGNLRALESLCDRIIAENLGIVWTSNAIIRPGMSRELFAKMHRAGCRALHFGLESGSDKVLNAMGKHYVSAVAQQTIRNAHDAGLSTVINLIVGFPGEGEAEFAETLDFLTRNSKYIHETANLTPLYLQGGSEVYAYPDRFGIEVDVACRTWRSADGIDYETRTRRLETAHAHLQSLNIAIAAVNREPAPAAPTPVENPVEQIAPTVAKLDSVTLTRKDGSAGAAFNAGDEVEIRLAFEVKRLLVDPLVRVNIHADLSPGADDVFVFGTNTARHELTLGELKPGDHEATLRIESLDLMPGRYRIAAGIWPNETAAQAFDHMEDAARFKVAGAGDPERGVAELGATFEPGDSNEEAADEDKVGSIEIPDGAETGSAFSVRIHVEIAQPDGCFLSFRVLREQFTVYRVNTAKPLPLGRHEIDLAFSPLKLLASEGGHGLRVSLLDPVDRKTMAIETASLFVDSKREQGAGLVHLAHRWQKN